MARQLPKSMQAKWTLSYHESRHCYLGNTNTDKGKLKVETTENRRRKLNELLSNLLQRNHSSDRSVFILEHPFELESNPYMASKTLFDAHTIQQCSTSRPKFGNLELND
ncbi:hypothetical protein NC651_040185 [Populus alba x Populus x berolinensis]|nr:hypothetical protein NC651_040185 [Populus alba x Populus x berolinensis]